MILRDYQMDIASRGTEIIRTHGMVYLAMEVRTGKTLTALQIAKNIGATFVLFVTKKKAKPDIEAQAKAFGMTVIVENYEQLHNVFHEFHLIIVDEAHSLGQYPRPSKRVTELKRLASYGRKIIYLSGTPTPESPSQIYHQFYISESSPFRQYKNFYSWAKDYVSVTKKYVYGRAINDYKKADKGKIEQATSHLFISFTQKQAGFTSMVNEQILNVKMEHSTYKFADALRLKKIITKANGDAVIADTAVKLMNKLHQIYSGTVIVDEPEVQAVVIDNTKCDFIKDYFYGKRIAIFYKFIAEGVMLRYHFPACTDNPTDFADGRSDVFISQVVAGREGINLSCADALVFLNIDYSATSYFQARARMQTLDRNKEAMLYWIFAEGGIEQKIYKAVIDKKDYTLDYFKKDFNIK